jgi:hypothetical protein
VEINEKSICALLEDQHLQPLRSSQVLRTYDGQRDFDPSVMPFVIVRKTKFAIYISFTKPAESAENVMSMVVMPSQRIVKAAAGVEGVIEFGVAWLGAGVGVSILVERLAFAA